MDREDPIAVIGTGRIGSVLASALDRAGCNVIIAARNHASAAALADSCMRARCLPIPEAVAKGSILVLAVPPEAYTPLLLGWADWLAPKAIIVSLTNGVTLAALGKATDNPIVKLVPTLAQNVRRGVIPVMAGPNATAADVETVMAMAALIGKPVLVDDEDARVASNVAGSALALMSRFGEAIVTANAARARHLGSSDLMAMIAETFGAVSDLVASGHSFPEIAAATATPGGVTQAQLSVLELDLQGLAERIVEAGFLRQTALQSESNVRLSQ